MLHAGVRTRRPRADGQSVSTFAPSTTAPETLPRDEDAPPGHRSADDPASPAGSHDAEDRSERGEETHGEPQGRLERPSWDLPGAGGEGSSRPASVSLVQDGVVVSGLGGIDASWVQLMRPSRQTTPLLAREAWFLLVAAQEEPLRRGGLTEALRVQAECLVMEGLLTEDGELTGDGRVVAEVLRAPLAMLTIDTLGAGSPRRMELLLGPEVGVALSTPEPLAEGGVAVDGSEEGMSLEVFELGWAPVAVAAWTGSGPARAWTWTPESISVELLRRHLEDPTMAPPATGVPEEMLALWRAPWLLWELKAWPSDERLLALRIADREPLLISADPGSGPTDEASETGARDVTTGAGGGEAGGRSGGDGGTDEAEGRSGVDGASTDAGERSGGDGATDEVEGRSGVDRGTDEAGERSDEVEGNPAADEGRSSDGPSSPGDGADLVSLVPASSYVLWRTLLGMVRRTLVAGAAERR